MRKFGPVGGPNRGAEGSDRGCIARAQEASEKRLEADGVFLAHGDELNAHALAGSDVSDQCGAADFAFGD